MRKSRLSQHKQNKLIELFSEGVTARKASELVIREKVKPDSICTRIPSVVMVCLM